MAEKYAEVGSDVSNVKTDQISHDGDGLPPTEAGVDKGCHEILSSGGHTKYSALPDTERVNSQKI